jgi:diacylglycerol kinase
MRIHVAAMIVVITLNALLRVTNTEWIVSLMLVGLMLMAEIFNTAIEKLADRVTKEHDQSIADIKDLASGAVTLLGFFAVVCALIIYLPYFMSL